MLPSEYCIMPKISREDRLLIFRAKIERFQNSSYDKRVISTDKSRISSVHKKFPHFRQTSEN